MSSDSELIVEVIPPGRGWALDQGGGRGTLMAFIEELGYSHLNLDSRQMTDQYRCWAVADAHSLPLCENSIDLLISEDTFEHFSNPQDAINEVFRV